MFSHPDYARAIGEAFGHPVQIAAVEAGSGWLAASVVFEKHRGPFSAAALPHLTPVLTPLLREASAETEINHRRSPLDKLLGALSEAYDQVTLQLHPSITDARPFAWSGWDVTPRYTHIADLIADDPVAGWSKSVRYTIKTEAEHYRIEEDSQFIAAGIARMESSYERKGKALGLSEKPLTEMVRKLARDGLVRVFAAMRGDETTPEAVAIIAHDGRTAHYWIAGSAPGPAMGVLLASVVPILKTGGITSLDFTGANVPSVAEFKRKYGAVLCPYYRVRRVSNPVLRVVDRLRPPR